MTSILADIEQVVSAMDQARSGSASVLAVLDQWPSLEPSDSPTEDWSKFPYLPVGTGSADRDESILMGNSYVPPKTFSPVRNETMALFCGATVDHTQLFYYPIKYRTKLALIDEEYHHTTISAGCVLTDGDSLLVHRRSGRIDLVHEAPGDLHTFCGNVRFRAEATQDQDTLADTCVRETLEESGVTPGLAGGRIGIIQWQQRMKHGERNLWHRGFDVVYLGAIAGADQMNGLKTRELAGMHWPDSELWEGLVVPLSAKALRAELLENYASWFPSGIAQILLWLAIGAPGASVPFREETRGLFSEVVQRFA